MVGSEGMMKIRVLLILLPLFLLPLSGYPAQVVNRYANLGSGDEQASNQLIVMIDAKIAGEVVKGAGIIFAREKDGLLIATANHVVRRGAKSADQVRITFFDSPGKSILVNMLPHADTQLDLTVLRAEKLSRHGVVPCARSFARLGNDGAIRRGDAVFPVGNPNGVPWGMPVAPDRVAQLVGRRISFQSSFISMGNSGGALVTDQGALVGMVTADQPPFGVAVRLDTILEKLEAWGYPVHLYSSVKGEPTPLLRAVETQDADAVAYLLTEGCADPNDANQTRWTPLQLAAANGNTDIIGLLMRAGANIDKDAEAYGDVPLNLAVKGGHIEAVKLLLSGGAKVLQGTVVASLDEPPMFELMLAQTPPLDAGILRAALKRGRAESLQRLLRYGIDPNDDSRWDSSLLHQAVKQKSVRLAQILLENGADPNRSRFIGTPLHLAAKQGLPDMIRTLIQYGADVDAGKETGNTPLKYALGAGNYPRYQNPEAVKVLLGAGAKVSAMGKHASWLLENASAEGDAEIVAMLLEAGTSPGESGPSGPLGHAIKYNKGGDRLAVVQLLLSHGADIDADWKEYGTPLLNAIYEGRTELAIALIAAGADLEASNLYRSQKKALHSAAAQGQLTVIEALLAHGANINARDQYEQTPLYLAARSGQTKVVQALLKAGADPSPEGARQPLHAAARQGHAEVARLLIEGGVEVDADIDRGTTALYVAAVQGHGAVIQQLTEAGASLKIRHYEHGTPLRAAVSADELESVEALIKAGADVNDPGNSGLIDPKDTLLHLVEGQNAVEIARALVRAGARLESLDKGGGTPLHSAAYSGKSALVGYLIGVGAAVDSRDNAGNTALHVATARGFRETARLLLDAGADASIRNASGETPLAVARRLGSDVFPLLKNLPEATRSSDE